MHLETRMKEILDGKRKGKRALWLLSMLYKTGVKLRHTAYQSRLLPIHRVPAVVVSVGNIVAGGTGKTPLVHLLASTLANDHTVAILSRGYASEAEEWDEPTRVEPGMSADEVGDEPLWLAQKLPAVQVWAGRDRVKSAQKAVENGAEIILLDDGFQHRRLHRDFDLVVTGDQPYSNGHFLPRGYLRDLPSRLENADLIAVMGNQKLDVDVPQVVFERKISANLQGKKVALFCAIANPHRFIQAVETLGGEMVNTYIKPDHEPFSLEELNMLARTADILVCTEKDFVKLPKTTLPIMPLPLELSIAEGDDVWKQFIHQIKTQVQHVRIPSHAS